MLNTKNKLTGGILLISGTTIGAGMLALPVVTGLAGFFPSLLLFIFYWIFMTFTAFLMLEANLWMDPGTHLIRTVKKTLGRGAALFSSIIYLFLLYALTTAYMAGSGSIFGNFFYSITHTHFPQWASSLPLLFFFGFFVFRGTASVDYINRYLMIGLVATFILMALLLGPYIDSHLLEYSDWSLLHISVAIVSTSFGFQIIIPTLTHYLDRDAAQCRKAIFIGSALPLVVYIIWELLTLGIIPVNGSDGIVEGYKKGMDAASILSASMGYSTLSLTARLFSLFAIITSFLGVSLSLFDALAEGLHIHKTPRGKILLYFLCFLPPLVITWLDPRAFLNALEFAGAFGVIILLAIIPILMVWKGRYYQHRTSEYETPGGKIALGFALFVSLAVIIIEIMNKSGILQ